MKNSVFQALQFMQYIDQIQRKLRVGTIPLSNILENGYEEDYELFLLYDDHDPIETDSGFVEKFSLIETVETGLDGIHDYEGAKAYPPDGEVYILFDSEEYDVLCVTLESLEHGFSVDIFPTSWEIYKL